jgi:hypothetical protein
MHLFTGRGQLGIAGYGPSARAYDVDHGHTGLMAPIRHIYRREVFL